MICNCGYEFDESATGIYGCPNCEGASVMKREIAANFVRAEKVNSATWQVTYPAETKNWDFRTMREKLFSGPGRYDQARKFRSEAVNMLCREENE